MDKLIKYSGLLSGFGLFAWSGWNLWLAVEWSPFSWFAFALSLLGAIGVGLSASGRLDHGSTVSAAGTAMTLGAVLGMIRGAIPANLGLIVGTVLVVWLLTSRRPPRVSSSAAGEMKVDERTREDGESAADKEK